MGYLVSKRIIKLSFFLKNKILQFVHLHGIPFDSYRIAEAVFVTFAEWLQARD